MKRRKYEKRGKANGDSESPIIFRKEPSYQQHNQSESCMLSWMVFQLKLFQVVGGVFFVFLKSTHISTNTLLGGKSHKIPSHCQASFFPKNTVLCCYLTKKLRTFKPEWTTDYRKYLLETASNYMYSWMLWSRCYITIILRGRESSWKQGQKLMLPSPFWDYIEKYPGNSWFITMKWKFKGADLSGQAHL